MLFHYEWLREYIQNIPSPEKILNEFTMHAVEVEEVIEGGADIGNVVVAELLEKRKHPNADKLNIGLFDVGEDTPRQIIFGGMAVLEVGDKIPLALAPTVLPGEKEILQKPLRGELSQGMCCLNSELGILNREDEVHRFAVDVPNGTHIAGVLPLRQTLIRIENTSITHRADLFNHLGLAREIAAVFDLPFVMPRVPALPKVTRSFPITVQEKTLCPRYFGVEMEVTMGATPEWIAERLSACGMRSINIIVDVTNYVMLEYGQPLHAFDADILTDRALVVRRAKKGERLNALDHVEHALTESMLVIADSKKPLALAGVIGGLNSGVTEQTKRIILEVANFEPIAIRKTAQEIGNRTESALRYEKGLSPELVQVAAQRAVELLQQHAQGKVLSLSDKKQKLAPQKPIRLSASLLQRIAGVPIPSQRVRQLLSRIECKTTVQKNTKETTYVVTPPYFRGDLRIPEDLIEEIIRLIGINTLPEQQLHGVLEVPQCEEEFVWTRALRDMARTLGATEAYNYSFYGEELLKKSGIPMRGHIEIANPLSEDLRYVRQSLLPRLLETIQRNQQYQENLFFFEIGHVHFTDREERQLAMVMSGKGDVYRMLKGAAASLCEMLHIPVNEKIVSQVEEAYVHQEVLTLLSQKHQIGTIGSIDQKILESFDIHSPVSIALFSLPALQEALPKEFLIQKPSVFPPVSIDLSFLVDTQIPWSALEKEIREAAGNWFSSLEVFDVYSGEHVPQGKKSIAFHLLLESHERTLTMKEVEEWRNALVERLHTQTGATLRDK